jgi:hypothetical protein
LLALQWGFGAVLLLGAGSYALAAVVVGKSRIKD